MGRAINCNLFLLIGYWGMGWGVIGGREQGKAKGRDSSDNCQYCRRGNIKITQSLWNA